MTSHADAKPVQTFTVFSFLSLACMLTFEQYRVRTKKKLCHECVKLSKVSTEAVNQTVKSKMNKVHLYCDVCPGFSLKPHGLPSQHHETLTF